MNYLEFIGNIIAQLIHILRTTNTPFGYMAVIIFGLLAMKVAIKLLSLLFDLGINETSKNMKFKQKMKNKKIKGGK